MRLTKDNIKRYVGRYYEALEKYKHHNAGNEGTTETAFKILLHNIALDLKLVLVKTTEKKTKNNIMPDGIIKDDFFRVVGYWEAKDTSDKLDHEIYKKISKGYPLTNIIFEDTQLAVLYQDGSEFDRYNLTKEDELTEMLIQFFNYKEPVYEEYRKAVEMFCQNIERLAEDFKTIIQKAKKADKSFMAAVQEFLEICELSFHRNITELDIEDMLIQHLLTERIFRKIFDNPEFASQNVIANQLEKLISVLTKHSFNRAKFFENTNQYYLSIEEQAAQFDDFNEKQQFLNKIYEAFFKSYSKKNADKNGIVYTPQSIVRFMVKFTESLLETEFNKTLSSKGVNIIDPCTGTGNFIMEVLRNIKPTALEYKYENEIFANEIMLLPYYISSANIEHYYYEATNDYKPFENIVFTDTLELIDDPRKKEKQQKMGFFFNEANSERAKRQLKSDLFVIIGNPPYNASQDNENQNNKNTANEIIDNRIAETYAKNSKAKLKNKLYDPYVKFFRWATDRLNKKNGIVCFITNNSFLTDIQFDGMRDLLLKDFNRIYHFDLGGDVYLNPKLSGTKNNVFGIKLGVGITFLIRNQHYNDNLIYYHNLNEYLTRFEKEDIINEYRNNYNKLDDLKWSEGYIDISNNYSFNNDKINEAKAYEKFILLNSNSQTTNGIFKEQFSSLCTNRDEWVYNLDKNELLNNIQVTIDFFNEELGRLIAYIKALPQHFNKTRFNIDDWVAVDETRMKWTESIKKLLLKMALSKAYGGKIEKLKINENNVVYSLHRPYTKKYFYYDEPLIHRPGRYYKFMDKNNELICLNGLGLQKGFSALITNYYPDRQTVYNCQVIPKTIFIETKKGNTDVKVLVSNITDWALKIFRDKCENKTINDSDIFYYVYAMLHHKEYIDKYDHLLISSSPRIPILPKDFKTISNIGIKLANLHLNYEMQKETPLKPTKETSIYIKEHKTLNFNIEKMKISKDKTTLTYNQYLSYTIPLDAWGYKVNGRTPLEWIVDQYKDYMTKTDEVITLMNKCITVTAQSKALIDKLSEIEIN